jgi:hypothetical protein
LVIGTFGRAAWVLDDIRPLREMAKNKPVIASNIKLFKPPIAYQASYQQPTGSRFGADAMYHGENREAGARFSYLINKKDQPKDDKTDEDEDENKNEDETDSEIDSEKEEGKVTWDSLTLKLYDGERLIRTLKTKAPKENGIHQWTWNMDEAGVDRPSRSIRKQTRESGGVSVKPGLYKAVLHYGDLMSETTIKVESDPRLEVFQKNINEVYATSKQIEKMQATAADAVSQLVESKTIAETYKKNLSKLDKEAYKNEIKASKDIVKSIDSLIDKYLGKVDKRQGITRNPEMTPLQRLGSASYYVSGSKTGLTSTEMTLIKHAKDALDMLLGETNTFFTKEWSTYQSTMKDVKMDPFKEIKVFGID